MVVIYATPPVVVRDFAMQESSKKVDKKRDKRGRIVLESQESSGPKS